MKKRLALIISAPLLIAALLSAVLLYFFDVHSATQRVEREAQDTVNTTLTHLQNILNTQLVSGNLEDARLSVSVSAMHNGVQTLLLSDENDRIMLANRYIWEGEPATVLDEYNSTLARRARFMHMPVVVFSEQRDRLRGYYPVTIKIAEKELGLRKYGVLFFEYDIGANLASAQRKAREYSALFGSLALLVAILVSLLLHKLVSKRIEKLVVVTQKFASGELDVRAKIKGRDEIAFLGQTFDAMAEQREIVEQALAEDIAARKRIEIELQKSKDQYDRLTANIPIGVYLLHTTAANEFFFKYVSARFCAMLETTAESVYADSSIAFKVIHPDDLAEFVRLNQVATQTREHFLWEGRMLIAGVTRWMRIESQPEKIEGGDCIWDGVVEDITERKLAQIELLRKQDLLNEAQRLGHLGSWELDLLNGALTWSDEIFQIFEIDQSRFNATYEAFLDAIHPDDRDMVNKAYTHSLETRAPYEIAHRLRMSDGRIKWVHERCQSTFDVAGKPLRSIGTVQDITIQHQAEELLRESEARYHSVISALSEGIVLNAKDGAIIAANESAERILGLTEDQLKGRTSIDPRWRAIHEDGTPFPGEMHPAAVTLRTGKPQFNIIMGVRKPEGTLTWISVNSQPIFEHGLQQPSAAVASFADITERKRGEQALAQSEALFRTLTQVAPVGIFRTDVSGLCTYVNNQYCEISGQSPESALGSGWTEAIHPDDLKHVFEGWNTSVNNHTPFISEHRFLHPDGEVVWAVVQSRAEKGSNGEVLGYVGTVTDINERKHAEERLRVEAVTFEMHEAIMITDANANIIRVNHAFQNTTGYSPEEVLGKNPRILSSGRQDADFYTEFWRNLVSTGSWSGEIWDRRKNGQIYPKWMTVSAVKNDKRETSEYVAIFSDISARKQAEEEIRNLAFYDSLTKLPNRRLLLDRFRLALSVSARSGKYGAVMFLDMDRFKSLNDTLGHDFGDLLLIEVAKRIQFCVREMDTVARLGGDEFVVLIEEVDENAEEVSQRVALIAEKIRAILATPYIIKGHDCHSSPSIGVSLYRGNAEPVDELLKHADMAMYQAKDSGRNAVRFFDPLMQQAVENHAALEADLRGAVARNQLHLYYQIQVDSEQRALGAEALIRWMHPQRGMVSPAQFIPIAEESSLILEIGNWVLDTACRQLALWSQNLETRHLILAINVSAQQFMKYDFVETVAHALSAHHVEPSRLKLELTESMVLLDVADVVKKMHVLKALGLRLSMDDFGTGYSSLSYLKQLPLDQIKIDQSFVRDIIADPNDAMMVQTIIDMARNFHLNVIAEGVETGAQLAFLKQNGCMAYQGYLFSKPVAISEFETLLTDYI